jgi:hypothetical protein
MTSALTLGTVGCSGGDATGSREVVGMPEPPTAGPSGGLVMDAAADAGIANPNAGMTPADAGAGAVVGATASVDAGTVSGAGSPTIHWLITTVDLNLRTGPSTSTAILRVIPKGSLVQLLDVTPVNGFLHVDHQGLVGWAYAAYLTDANVPGTSSAPAQDAGSPAIDAGVLPGSSVIAGALDRAKSGVGFSYWWAHGRWLPAGPTPATAGSCSGGGCPNCTHAGSYGADCSGYVGKIWQVPASNGDITVDGHPYSTREFINDTPLWSTIGRGTVKLGDALVYNQGTAGHIFLYAAGDGWGAMDAYECKGCATGCVFDNRTAGSAYKAIRRTGY